MTTDQQAFALAEPGTPEYAAAVATYNLDVRLQPRFAVTVRDAGEARQAIAEARARGLGVRILATGHLSDACAPLGDEVVVRVAFDEPVRVDVEARRATVHATAGSAGAYPSARGGAPARACPRPPPRRDPARGAVPRARRASG
jgi:hypothetical protein